MLEPKAGVFVGRPSAMVRDKLWDRICERGGHGGGLLIHSSDNEQGYRIRTWGETSRMIEDFDGLSLVRMP
ncbi:MAG: type I-E CRISPR-associated endoribonuclease Cas2e [Thermoleophilia bacterium]